MFTVFHGLYVLPFGIIGRLSCVSVALRGHLLYYFLNDNIYQGNISISPVDVFLFSFLSFFLTLEKENPDDVRVNGKGKRKFLVYRTVTEPTTFLQSGPSCSKLTTSLVNDSLKFTASDTQIR